MATKKKPVDVSPAADTAKMVATMYDGQYGKAERFLRRDIERIEALIADAKADSPKVAAWQRDIQVLWDAMTNFLAPACKAIIDKQNRT